MTENLPSKITSVLLATLISTAAMMMPQIAQAVINYNVVCSVPALKTAIDNANTDLDDSILNLAAGCDYALTDTDNIDNGNNGLPSILPDGGSSLTINGNNALIRRSNGRICEADATDPDSEFRMFVVRFGVPSVTLNDLTVTDFCSTDSMLMEDGGAILAADNGSPNNTNFFINRSTFRNNETDNDGRGGVLFTRDGNCTITDSFFMDNTANGNQAGALYIGGDLTVSGSTFTNNTADDDQGGAIFVRGDGSVMMITDSIFIGNTADGNQGGAIFIFSSNKNVMITNSTFTDNTAIGNQGGAIFSFGSGVMDISNSTFKNNRSLGNQGGAIFTNDDDVHISNSTFDNNEASGNQGGALYIWSENLNITGSTFRENITDSDGGAIYSRADNTNILNSTFYANQAGPDSDDEGGAIFTNSDESLNITNSTFVDNIDGNDNTFNDGAFLTLKNSIVVNTIGNNCAVAAVAGQDNLLSDTSCGAGASFNLGAATALLPIGNYGGPTQTIALTAGSNALDAVTDCTAVSSGTNPLFNDGDIVAIDQRGDLRPDGPECDIGAFEGVFSIAPIPTVSMTGLVLMALSFLGLGRLASRRQRG